MLDLQPGTQVYDDFLTDQTDAGTSWDTSLNYRSYLFDSTSGQFSFLNSTSSPTTSSSASATSNAAAAAQSAQDINEVNEGVEWLTYSGYYGDKRFDDDDKRQFCVFGHCRYTDGPLGEHTFSLPFGSLSGEILDSVRYIKYEFRLMLLFIFFLRANLVSWNRTILEEFGKEGCMPS